jgi:hypothetical protein
MADIRKILYIGDDGVQARTVSGDITNIGGTTHQSFAVNGKGLIFDDGTSTTGGVVTGFSLQSAYNNSSDSVGNAAITLQTGKDFAIYDDNNSAIFFKIESTTGNVTITGNLTVLGNATIIRSTSEVTDHWNIAPSVSSTTALKIEPQAGVYLTADLITLRNTFGGSPVFRVDASGKTLTKDVLTTGNLTVTGTINSVDIVALNNEVNDHLFAVTFPKHLATQISISPIPLIPLAHNVQEALSQLSNHVATLSGVNGLVTGIEFTQATPSLSWTILHNQNTKKIHFTVYDENDEWMVPDNFSFINSNTVEVKFGRLTAGRAVLMMFN